MDDTGHMFQSNSTVEMLFTYGKALYEHDT